MHITRVEPFHVNWGKNKSAWVRLWTDTGLYGLGEASPMAHGNASLEIIASVFAPMLIGADPLAQRVLQDRLFHQHIKIGPEGAYAGALAAVDIALWDLKGKLLGQPIYQLLGGAWRTELPFYASIGNNGVRSVDEVCRVVEAWMRLEPAQVKIRFDADKTTRDADLAGDIAKARAVRKLVGEGFPLAFDANNGYSVQGAIRIGRVLEELGYVWFEEPVQHYHTDSFTKVAAALDIAVAAGEQEYTLQGIKRLIEAGVDIVQPDIVKTGGFTGLSDMAALARAYGVDFVPHQTQPSVGHTASLHFVAALAHAHYPCELYDYVRCGILAHGFLRLGCDACHHEVLVPFSGKRRGFCPSCAGRRMAQTAAHLVEQVLPWVPMRPWVVSVPTPLRYWMASSRDLTATVHTIIRTTIGHYDVNQAVQRGRERATVDPGSVTFLQRFGSALNRTLHFHVIGLAGVDLERTATGRKPQCVTAEPPTAADSAAVVHTISQRVIRKLRRLGSLETDMAPPVATGYDPLRDTAPELACTMAAAVQQRIAGGDRAGQPVRRIGAGFGSEGEAPRLTGPRCASVHGFSVQAHTAIPAHRRDQLAQLIRSTARGAVALERLQADANGDLVYTFTHPWSDGTTGMRLAPLELLEKLAALVPLPHVHLVRYGGCLAPHRHLRGASLPTTPAARTQSFSPTVKALCASGMRAPRPSLGTPPSRLWGNRSIS